MGRKHSQEEIINKFVEVHGDDYVYDLVKYINIMVKVEIICKTHGMFPQSPLEHIKGSGCPKCYGNAKLTYEEFVNRANEVHGGRFDYSKFVYLGYEKPGIIICKEHGEFPQIPHSHLSGNGCPRCRGLYKTTQDIIKEFKEIHGNKFDYSKFEYIKYDIKGIIICPEHGEFLQSAHHHIKGAGCRKCFNKKISVTLEDFINFLPKEDPRLQPWDEFWDLRSKSLLNN